MPGAFFFAADAQAQEVTAAAGAPAAAKEADTKEESSALEEIIVTGYRAALQSALALKRDAAIMVDAINAEDIADFSDANLAESLQRLPGISIDRDSGEGRKITVRGRRRACRARSARLSSATRTSIRSAPTTTT